ncbi:MAG: hypothetical protein AB1813_02065 [Verrucomicrobiota bacterium]
MNTQSDPVTLQRTPGNYLLRQTREGLEYVWFDVNGSERIEEVFPVPAQ